MHVSKHYFMWHISLALMDKKLNIMEQQKVKIPPISILRDLNVFLRAEEVLTEKLNQLQKFGSFDKAKPWMVKCDDEVLEKYFSLIKKSKRMLSANRK